MIIRLHGNLLFSMTMQSGSHTGHLLQELVYISLSVSSQEYRIILLRRSPADNKAVEYLVYVFGLCPALLYDVLPPKFYYHFCQLVFAGRVVHLRYKSKEDLLAAHNAFLEFVYTFEILYYECKLTHLHFVRPCIHALTHITPEHFCLGSLTELSQWTME